MAGRGCTLPWPFAGQNLPAPPPQILEIRIIEAGKESFLTPEFPQKVGKQGQGWERGQDTSVTIFVVPKVLGQHNP